MFFFETIFNAFFKPDIRILTGIRPVSGCSRSGFSRRLSVHVFYQMNNVLSLLLKQVNAHIITLNLLRLNLNFERAEFVVTKRVQNTEEMLSSCQHLVLQSREISIIN